MLRRGPLTRRNALSALGGATLTVSAIGTPNNRSGGVEGEHIRVTVGYASPAGAQVARDRAHDVVYGFDFDALTVIVAEPDIEALQAHNEIRYVERDRRYWVMAQTLPWGIDRVDADAVHSSGATGDGADIAIIDTGIDRTHPDLAENLGKGVAFEGGVQSNKWQDDNGHGTHCAGIAAAIDNDRGVVGVAPSATLHAVKVVAAPGSGLSSDVAKGIEWVANQGYDVGSLSIGGDHIESVAEACEYAAKKGVTLVAAAGNAGPCRDCVVYPAGYPEVIAVSATTKDDELVSSSSKGPEVELAAPGKDIYSTYLGGYTTLTGTSMACPHVSGAAGQLAASGHSRDEIRQTLKETAEDIGLSSHESGAGLLDVAASRNTKNGTAQSDAQPTQSRRPTSTPASTETASSTPTATEHPSTSPHARGGAELGRNRTTSTSTASRPSHPSPSPRTHTRTADPSTSTATAAQTRPSAAASPYSPTSTSSSSAGTPSTGGTSSPLRGVRRAVGSVVDTIVDTLTGLLP